MALMGVLVFGKVGLWKHIRRAGIALCDLLDMMLEMELK